MHSRLSLVLLLLSDLLDVFVQGSLRSIVVLHARNVWVLWHTVVVILSLSDLLLGHT